ncbi:MAG: Na/Pi cotransporter family protein [Kiritimatiellae bacterium]|nr:Na/Pi cotransporter family protein [Kiritimatiellia bacterium]
MNDFKIIFDILANVTGGLCIFLLGMKNMSEGMQAIAGTRLRRMIGAATNNRFAACGTGAIVTSLIQSSSVTAVMTVGFVNAGVMTLIQAIGVILGADIGTTITGWIVSLDVAKYGLPLLGVSGFFYLFTQKERVRYLAMMIMGIGMVFFGLQLMKHGLEPMSESEQFKAWFYMFQPTSYLGVIKCVMVGAFVTAIVQSSSATVAITMTLAGSGVIDFRTAVALVLGQNIGTTITAYLASLGTSTNAKRAAYAHVLTKIIGVILAISLFFLYMNLLENILSKDLAIEKKIAFAHTLFNIMLVGLFLPLRNPLAALLIKIAPDKTHKEQPHLTFLDVRLLDTPAFGIQQSAEEIKNMDKGLRKMFDWVRESFAEEERNDERDKHVFHREEVLDIMQKEIVEFLGQLLAGSITHEVLNETRQQLRTADEYESISDYLVTILKLNLKMHNLDLKLSKEGRVHILDLHDHVANYVKMICDAVNDNNTDIMSKANTMGHTITHIMKDYRHAHLVRIENKHISPLNSLVFIDILQSYRKIKDHALNVAEAIAGDK